MDSAGAVGGVGGSMTDRAVASVAGGEADSTGATTATAAAAVVDGLEDSIPETTDGLPRTDR